MNANPEAEIQKQREKTRTSRGWGVNLKDQEVGLWDVLRRRATSGVGAEGGWSGGSHLRSKEDHLSIFSPARVGGGESPL